MFLLHYQECQISVFDESPAYEGRLNMREPSAHLCKKVEVSQHESIPNIRNDHYPDIISASISCRGSSF